MIAIFLALSGGVAWASHPGGANTINSADIIDGQVKEPDVGQGAVASPELKNDSVAAGDVAPNSLTSGRIADGSLTGTDVANNSLTGADVDEDTLVGGPTNPTGPAGGDLTGTYPDPEIAANAVGPGEISNAPSGSDDVNADRLDGSDRFDFVAAGAVFSHSEVVTAGAPDALLFGLPGARLWGGCSASQTKVRYEATASGFTVWRDNGGGDAEVFRPVSGEFIDAVNGNADNLGEMLTFVTELGDAIFVAAVRDTGPNPDECQFEAVVVQR